jgi:hypothetical protein
MPGRPLSPSSLGAVVDHCARHGVLPAAIRNMRRAAEAGTGRLLASGSAAADKESLHKILAGATERLVDVVGRSELLRVVESELVAALRTQGLDPIVLKGTSFADRLYPDASLRPFTDIDILVSQRAMPDARQTMAGAGFAPVAAGARRHETDYAEEHWIHPVHKDLLIELHWDLVASPRARRSVSLPYEDLRPLIGPYGAPSAAALLQVAAIHGAAGHGFELLQHVVDVAQAARRGAGTFDAAELSTVAKQKGQRLAIETALMTAALIMSDRASADLARRMRAGASAWWLSRLLGVATVVESRGRRHSRHSWRRQLYREALIRLAS